MTIISLFKIVELKKGIEEIFGLKLHAHDACPSQYFNFDEKISEKVKDYIKAELETEKSKVVFEPDNKSFYLADTE